MCPISGAGAPRSQPPATTAASAQSIAATSTSPNSYVTREGELTRTQPPAPYTLDR
jgi:hypothetical protein